MSSGYLPGQQIPQLTGRGMITNSGLNQGTNNIGQVYQDMGQNYQRFGQAYQQATQAANQLRSASTTQQQQMNQYLQALQTALGGMSTAGQNTTNQQPMGQPDFYGFTGFEDNPARFNAGQTLGAIDNNGLPLPSTQDDRSRMINAQTQFLTGTIPPDYTNFLNAPGSSRIVGGSGPGTPNTRLDDAFGNYFTEQLNNGGYVRGGDRDVGSIYQEFLGLPQQDQMNYYARAIGAPSMNPQDLYNQYSSVVFGQPASAYTPNFQG